MLPAPRPRRGVVCALLAAALLLAMAWIVAPSSAGAAVTSNVASGVLTVTSDAGDAIGIACSTDSPSGSVRVNGGDPGSGPASCSSISAISVTGGPGANAIDLAGVGSTAFSGVPDGQVTIDGGAGGDTVDASQFADTVLGFDGDDTLRGGPGDDLMGGEAGADRLEGEDGVDELVGGDEDDTVLGGAGDDQALEGGFGADTVGGGAGKDLLYGGQGSDALEGGDGEDRLSGDPSYPERGQEGDDTLSGGDDTDTVAEAADVDFTLTNTALEGLGKDSLSAVEVVALSGGSSSNTLDASAFSAGDVKLSGYGGNDRLIGGAGNDEIGFPDPTPGEVGDDTLTGGPGNDTFTGGTGTDRVAEAADVDLRLADAPPDPKNPEDRTRARLEGLGTDTLRQVEEATLTGGPSANTLDASAFSRKVILTGGAGDDVLAGGTGPGDRLVEEGDVDLSLADDRLDGLGTDTLSGIEEAALTGGPSANALDASGFGGKVTLTGGMGDDALTGGRGTADRLVEAGDLDFTLTDGRLRGAGTDTLSRIEEAALTGGPSANALDASGFSGRVVLEGGAGADALAGGQSGDALWGGAGGDFMTGGRGDDELTGGPENDTLIGGVGDDRLLGEAGVDAFSGEDGDDALLARDGEVESAIACGAGFDTVSADREDTPAADCERVRTPLAPIVPTPSPAPADTTGPTMVVTGGRLSRRWVFTAALRCPAAESLGCSGSYRLITAAAIRAGARARRVTLARGTFRAPGGGSAVVRSTLSRRSRTVVRRLRRLRVRLIVDARDGLGNARTTTKTLSLRAPKRRR